jgi:hypothetical protein
MEHPDRRHIKLTPDGIAYAMFLRDASIPTGAAVSHAVLCTVEAIDLSLSDEDPEYTDHMRDSDVLQLAHLFPVTRALDPDRATELALKYPFLWGADGEAQED